MGASNDSRVSRRIPGTDHVPLGGRDLDDAAVVLGEHLSRGVELGLQLPELPSGLGDADVAAAAGIAHRRDLLVDGGDLRAGCEHPALRDEAAVGSLLLLADALEQILLLPLSLGADHVLGDVRPAGLTLQLGHQLAGVLDLEHDVGLAQLGHRLAGADVVPGRDQDSRQLAAGGGHHREHVLAPHQDSVAVDLDGDRADDAPDDDPDHGDADRDERQPAEGRGDLHHHVEPLGRRELLEGSLSE